MLCSECKKNTAVVFINKIENGVSTMEGLGSLTLPSPQKSVKY